MTGIGWLLFALAQGPTGDIDAFMEKVLQKRDVNWEQYYNYFCTERAVLSIEGSIPGVPIQGFTKEYLWFVRDGYLVRSPLTVDGVAISAEDRERAEKKFIERSKKRDSRRGPDRESFFGLEFEPGNSFFAGNDQFEGRDVVVVEYYPDEDAFSDDEDDEDDEIAAQLAKVLVVRMLIDVKEHQIVRMSLDNVGFDFLPVGWLVKLDTVETSLTMHNPIEDIWLTRDIEAYGRITTAGGGIAVRYSSTFFDYTKAETSATYRFPPRSRTKPKR